MSASWVAPLVPDPGLTLERDRITRAISATGTRTVLLVAPSGYGKTVSAAHFCKQHDGRTIWLTFGGDSPTAFQVLRMLVRPSAEATERGVTYGDYLEAVCEDLRQHPSTTVIVLDDVSFTCRADLQDILEWACALRGSGTKVVITTRALPAGAGPLRDAALLDVSALRVTVDEALTLAATLHAVRHDDEAVRSLRETCRGHAALLSLMLLTEEREREVPDPSDSARMHVRQLIGDLDSDTRLALAVASIFSEGRILDLESAGVHHARRHLEAASLALPLVRLEHSGVARADRFVVHDLARDVLAEEFQCLDLETKDRWVASVLRVMQEHDSLEACLRVLAAFASDSVLVEWLEELGARCVSSGRAAEVAALIDSLPVQQVMGRPGLLLIWAEATWELGEPADALARARASYVLLSHNSDRQLAMRAAAMTIDCYRELGRLDEAESLAVSVQTMMGGTSDWTADFDRALGAVLVARGRFDEARCLLLQARNMAASSPDVQSVDIPSLDRLLASLHTFAEGDFARTARALGPLLRRMKGRLTARAIAKGNMGVCLVETGRLQRASALLRSVISLDSKALGAFYTVPLGCAEAGMGAVEQSASTVAAGIAMTVDIGDESETAIARVYQAVLMRATGMVEDSLVSAERSYEQLASDDYMQFRRLAALEVAASLLALGDETAARNWAEPVVSAGFGQNQHHALRAAMILAMCDLRDGDPGRGTERLKPFAAHVRSENSNWQAAMYMRAFPELLGMFAEAFGVKALPTHMLRMVLPQHAERSLRCSKRFMQPAVWEELGLRVLGKTQFAQLVERNGQPICHVRLFAGLEVSVDGRVVQERDWRKRKARLLFAMLAVRRGAEIPRDELLDHLWPEMDADRAKNNFYVAWSAMKAALMGCSDRSATSPYIQSTRGRCRVVREAVRLDLDEFDEALTAAREAEAAGDAKAAVSAYERVSATYRGDLLSGDVYDDWFAPIRDGYRIQFIDAMAKATELLLAEDDPCEALLYVRRGLGVDPLREDLYQLALRSHILAGQRSAAIDTFLQCRSNLGEELGLDPSGETMKLYQEVLAMEECPRTDSYGLS